MKHRMMSFVMASVLCLGLSAPVLAFSKVSPLIMSYEDDDILESKQEAVSGYGDDVWIDYAQAGRSIRLKQHPEFQGVIQTVSICATGSEDKVYYFQRSEDDTTPMGVLTVTFESGKTPEGKTVNLSDPNKTYVLSTQTHEADGSDDTNTLFFRVVGGSTTPDIGAGTGDAVGGNGNTATGPGYTMPGQPSAWTAEEEYKIAPFILGFQKGDVTAAGQGSFDVRAGSSIQVKQDPDTIGYIEELTLYTMDSDYNELDATTYFSQPEPDDVSTAPLMEPVTITFESNPTNSIYDLEAWGRFPETLSVSARIQFHVVQGDAQEDISAIPNRSTVLVNGQNVQFDAYTIHQNNYFKLRDLAKILSGTGKQFEVTWDGEKNAIQMCFGKPYTAVGGELAAGDGTNKTAVLNASALYLDGQPIQLTAYTIQGNNYFKLRDVGAAFDFGVDWDGANNTIVINTSKGYTPN